MLSLRLGRPPTARSLVRQDRREHSGARKNDITRNVVLRARENEMRNASLVFLRCYRQDGVEDEGSLGVLIAPDPLCLRRRLLEVAVCIIRLVLPRTSLVPHRRVGGFVRDCRDRRRQASSIRSKRRREHTVAGVEHPTRASAEGASRPVLDSLDAEVCEVSQVASCPIDQCRAGHEVQSILLGSQIRVHSNPSGSPAGTDNSHGVGRPADVYDRGEHCGQDDLCMAGRSAA